MFSEPEVSLLLRNPSNRGLTNADMNHFFCVGTEVPVLPCYASKLGSHLATLVCIGIDPTCTQRRGVIQPVEFLTSRQSVCPFFWHAKCRRKAYDQTGCTDDELLSNEGQELYEYFRAMFPKVTEEDIDAFYVSIVHLQTHASLLKVQEPFPHHVADSPQCCTSSQYQ